MAPKVDDVRQLIEETDQIKGLGDVVHKVTKALGIKECSKCKKRREWLNEHVPLSREKQHEAH